jgi:hypothetical protein
MMIYRNILSSQDGADLMKKLTLNVEELRVDGFATSASDPRDSMAAQFATLRCTTICTEIGSCGHICPA